MDIRPIVASALTAPTADNCQPWNYLWKDGILDIRQDDDRARAMLNPESVVSLLSLGCVLELIRIASSAQGLEARYERCGIGARVRFEAAATSADPLFAAIALRATDRRLYRGGMDPDPALLDILRRLDSAPGSELRYLVQYPDRYPANYLRYVSRCEGFVWTHRESTSDLLGWLRLSRREIERCDDGMPWPCIGARWIEAQALRVMRLLPWAIARLFTATAKFQARSLIGRQIRSSSAVLGIAVHTLSDDDLLAAGRTLLRTWLSLNAAGYGVQPTIIHSYLSYLTDRGLLRSHLSSRWMRLIHDGKSTLRESFGFAAGSHPIWVFRVGKSTPLPPRMRTKRRRLEDCLVIEGGN
jgi:sulfur-carrier protein adenylyltransferase/sulfurtransferase